MAKDPYAITTADLDDGLRRVLRGDMGPAGYAMGRVLSDLFRAKGYDIVIGCGTGGPEDGPDGRAGAYLVCEKGGNRKAVLLRLYRSGETAGRRDVVKLVQSCRKAGASAGVLVADSEFPPECEEARRQSRIALEFWSLERAISEMREHLKPGP